MAGKIEPPDTSSAGAALIADLIAKLTSLQGSVTRERFASFGAWPVGEYVDSWGVGGSAVAALIETGEIRTKQVGRLLVITRAEHERFLARLEADEVAT